MVLDRTAAQTNDLSSSKESKIRDIKEKDLNDALALLEEEGKKTLLDIRIIFDNLRVDLKKKHEFEMAKYQPETLAMSWNDFCNRDDDVTQKTKAELEAAVQKELVTMPQFPQHKALADIQRSSRNKKRASPVASPRQTRSVSRTGARPKFGTSTDRSTSSTNRSASNNRNLTTPMGAPSGAMSLPFTPALTHTRGMPTMTPINDPKFNSHFKSEARRMKPGDNPQKQTVTVTYEYFISTSGSPLQITPDKVGQLSVALPPSSLATTSVSSKAHQKCKNKEVEGNIEKTRRELMSKVKK